MMKGAVIAVLMLPLFAGCQPAESPAAQMPQAIASHDRCHLCGMVILQQPGPKGELQMNDGLIAKFCSTRDLFSFALQPENQHRISQIYVHDSSSADWEHPDDHHFIDATTAWYVYGSRRKGAMGPSLASFSQQQSAQVFAEQWGGAVLNYQQITLALLEGTH